MHDLVIRGAMVADGVGNPLIRTDVAVKGERIAEVGDVTESARETVDADGLVLAPGIVDVHTHYDAQITWESQATPSPSLGVTTVVMGNCGFSIAPCPPERREQMARNLAEVEGMSIAALEAGIDWSFEGLPGLSGAAAGARGAIPTPASSSAIRRCAPRCSAPRPRIARQPRTRSPPCAGS